MASWFRWYHGCVSDPKLGVVARKCKKPKYLVIAVWAALLEMASQASDRGDVSGFEADDFGEAIGADTEAVQAVFDALREKGLVDVDRVAAWAKRQFEGADNTAAERQKRKRQRDKANVTDSHAVTAVTERDVTEITASDTEQTQIQNRTEIKSNPVAAREDDGLELPEFMRRAPPVQTRIVAGGFKQIGAGKRLKNPRNADAAMEAFLASHCSMDELTARNTVSAARTPSAEGHIEAARLCEKISREHKLGWFHEEAGL